MHDPYVMITVVATFLLAGMVKGVIGLGLPTVVLGLLTAALDLPTAMTLLIVPSLVTNAFQAGVGGNGRTIFRRIWPFLLMATAMVSVGAKALTRVDLDILSGLLGILMISYAVINLVGIRFTIPLRHETWAGLVFGAVNGILTGMTGSFLMPGVMFLQAIGLPRDMLIQAMGMLFSASTLALALALRSNNFMDGNSVAFSAVLVAPALIGMFVGAALRKRLPESRFRQVFFPSILILGVYIVIKAV